VGPCDELQEEKRKALISNVLRKNGSVLVGVKGGKGRGSPSKKLCLVSRQAHEGKEEKNSKGLSGKAKEERKRAWRQFLCSHGSGRKEKKAKKTSEGSRGLNEKGGGGKKEKKDVRALQN